MVSWDRDLSLNGMDKKIIFYIAFAAILGGIIGSSITVSTFSAITNSGASSGFFNNLFKGSTSGNNGTSTMGNAAPYVATVDYEEKVIGAVDKTKPGVVSVIISKLVPIIDQCPGANPFGDLPQEFRDFFGDGTGYTVPCEKGTQKQDVGGGSGFIIDKSGLIVTNKHVVSDTKAEYTVVMNDGKKYKAEVLARDPVLDIAILKIQASGLVALKLGDSSSLQLGQSVIAIGNALGEFKNTVSVGVISGLARNITAGGGGTSESIEGVIQTDAAINPGNSGGPLLNLKGEVIGMNTAVASGAQSIGFAIPINQAKRAINSVSKTGRIVTPYIGIRYLVLNEESAKKEKLPITHGALVRGGTDGPGVVKNSPASKAGILAEDVILQADGIDITEERSLSGIIQEHQVGDVIKLKVLRDGKEITISVALEEKPAF